MLSNEFLLKSQSKYGVGTSIKDIECIPYANYLNDLRANLSNQTPAEFYSWGSKKQQDFTEKFIADYIRRHTKPVEGFVNDAEENDTEHLLGKLIEDIVDAGILKKGLTDPAVQELQINDCKTIFEVKGGIATPYLDENGNPLQFENDTELHSTIEKLIARSDGSAPRMTITNPIMNTSTALKGYRLSALNNSAITSDLTPGCDFPVTCVTIRKPSESKISFEDLVKWGSLTPKMVRLLKLCSRANLNIFCVGVTNSGKTTLVTLMFDYFLEYMFKNHMRKRVIFIQNPTELRAYKRNMETLANAYNALHWEAQDVQEDRLNDPTTPTMEHLLALSLRHSPDIIIPGELRLKTEFEQAFKALSFDQRIISTFHAEGGNGALGRWASEVSTVHGGNSLDILYSLARSVNIVISQSRFDDGKRRVTGIEEITGEVSPTGVVSTNLLAGFQLTGDVERNEDGSIKEIKGKFVEDGKISNKLVQKFYAAGITKDELREFME